MTYLLLLKDIELCKDWAFAPPVGSKEVARVSTPLHGESFQMDRRLHDALRDHRFVLVHGPSAAGKSKVCSRGRPETLMAIIRSLFRTFSWGSLAALLDAGVLGREYPHMA